MSCGCPWWGFRREGNESMVNREKKGKENERRLGELTLRGDIESFAILQKKNNARKCFSGGERTLFALAKASERESYGVRRRFKRVDF